MKTLKCAIVLAVSAFFITTTLWSQPLPAYQIFDKDGLKVDFGTMAESSSKTTVVLFGELHNNPISHWLQLELTKALFEKAGTDLVLGAEMFEADTQIVIDEYLNGTIAERNFKAEARPWNNYETDYKPLVEFARTNQLPFIATNIPRRYASVVNRQGFEGLEALTDEAKRFIAPLPPPYDPELPGYKAMLDMAGMPGRTNENFPKAQAIKDATMGHFIHQNLNGQGVFMHFHGTYHSNNFEGIFWYLKQIDPDIKIITISTVEQENIDFLEGKNLGQANFIIAVPQTMTKTY
jgi:uncharacterized iron-regulated protein